MADKSKIVIITVPGCPWCSRAISLAEENKYSLEVKNMSWGPELREIQSNLSGWKTVPMVYVHTDGVETFIGGFTEFVEFVREDVGQKEVTESQG